EFDCHFLNEGFTAKDILDQKINEVSSDDDKHAFYVADLGDILKKHLRCRTIVKMPAAIGTGFDCAKRITYANPCKQMSQIKYTVSNGVQMMTFDSEVELMKIATDDSKAVCHLSVKFGALDIDVIGVNFHVESGCTDPETFVQVISDVGFNMYLLDIGGDFPGSEDYFPSDSGVRIIPELGRYYVASAFTLTVNIIAKKLILKEQTASDDEEDLLQKRSKPDEKYYSSSIWRPICDGLDHIVEHCTLRVGNWMLFENMGAYTVAAASTFSGFQRPTQIQNQDSSTRVEERDVSPLHPALCLGEQHLADCAPTHVNM
ncbi:hypothetical protein FD755_019045, partial [Muntiacus reevesi]